MEGHTSGNITYGIISAITSGTSITLANGVDLGSGAAAASTYDIFCPLVPMGNGTSPTTTNNGFEYGIAVKNLDLDCNNIAGCEGIRNWFGGQHSYAFDVNVHNFCGQGFVIEGINAQNSGPWENLGSYGGTCAGAATIPFFIDESSGIFNFSNLSFNKGVATTQPNIGIDLNGNGVSIDHIDAEQVGIGVAINDYVACTPACAYGSPFADSAARAMHISDLHGSATTGARIFSNNGSPEGITLANFPATQFTNFFIDSANSCTDVKGSPDYSLALYILGEKGTPAYSTTSACPVVLNGGANTQLLTADSSGVTATTPGTTEWSWGHLTPSTNYSFHCSVLFSQATGAGGVGLSVQSATTAATRWDAWAKLYTTNPASTTVTATLGSTLDITSTTATSVASATPGATGTVYQGELDGTIQTGSTAGTLNVLVYSGSSSDAVTVKAGSFFTVLP